MILSSRSSTPKYTDDMLIAATKAAVNVVDFLQNELSFPDKSYIAVVTAHEILLKAIQCFEFDDYIVTPVTGTLTELHFKIEIKPFKDSDSYISFIGKLKVQS